MARLQELESENIISIKSPLRVSKRMGFVPIDELRKRAFEKLRIKELRVRFSKNEIQKIHLSVYQLNMEFDVDYYRTEST